MNKFEQIQPLFEQNLREAHRSIDKTSWEREDIGVNAVFGLSTTDLPARFLAGFIPAFALSDALSRPEHAPAQLRIFVPMHLSVACGTHLAHAQEIKNEGLLFIQKFHEVFHPEVQWFLDIDKPLTTEGQNHLISLTEHILSDAQSIEPAWTKIFRAAAKRGSQDHARIYGPHHAFGWQDAWDPQSFFEPRPKFITINCMSKSEEPFQEVRRQVTSVLARQNSSLLAGGEHRDMITTSCKRPHYLLAQAEGNREPTIQDLLNMGAAIAMRELEGIVPISTKFRDAHRDLAAIDRHVKLLRSTDPNKPNFDEFIQEVRRAT